MTIQDSKLGPKEGEGSTFSEPEDAAEDVTDAALPNAGNSGGLGDECNASDGVLREVAEAGDSCLILEAAAAAPMSETPLRLVVGVELDVEVPEPVPFACLNEASGPNSWDMVSKAPAACMAVKALGGDVT